MAHVINRNYSKFYDVKTRVQFEPVLDGRSGAHVAYASTEAEYGGRPGFEVLSDAEYLALIGGARDAPSAAAGLGEAGAGPTTGDPVADAASAAKAGPAATSDSRRGRRADGRRALAAGDMIDPASPAAAARASTGIDAAEGGKAGPHD